MTARKCKHTPSCIYEQSATLQAFLLFCYLYKLFFMGVWGMREKLWCDMAFFGIVFAPMKLKRFRETRKFYPCNFFTWYPKLSHVVFNTTSSNIKSHIIHFPKLSHTFRTLNHTTIPQHSLHHTIKSLISHHIISNTTINGIKYNYT